MGVFHYRLPTPIIVFFNRNLLSYVLFGNAQLFFYLKLYRKTMGIPATFSFYLKASQRLVSTKNIFYSSGHDVVNARGAIGRGWALIESECGVAFPSGYRSFKYFVFLPKLKHFFTYLWKI